MTLPRIDVLLDTDSGRGNQTGELLDSSPETLYNPGYADSGNAPTRDGNISIDAQPDLSQPAKTTLGNYLSNATRGQVYKSRANTFTLPEGSSSTEGDAYSVSENTSTHTSPSQAAEQIRSAGTTLGTFLDLTKGLNSDASTNFTNTKNSDYGGGDNPFVETDIKKVGSVERSKGSDGHTLLPGIRGRSPDSYGVVDLGNPQNIRPVPESAPLVQRKISEVLLQNRFNSIERPFVNNHKRTSPGGFTVQRTMGQYNPDAPEVSEDKLQGVAQQLLVRATGHAVPGIDLFDFNSPDILTNLVPLVPSLTQATGLPIINASNLEARNVPITDAPVPQRSEYIDQEYNEFKPFAGNSYGVLNSDLEPFSDPFPIGTITATVGSLISVIAASFIPTLIISLANPTNSRGASRINSNDDSTVGPYTLKMGSSNKDDDESFWLDLLQIPRTDYSWGACFIVGFANFLAVDIRDEVDVNDSGAVSVSAAELGEAFLEALLEFVKAPPGYYASILRNAARSTERIVNAISEIVETFSGSDFVGGAARLWSFIGTVTDSAVWRFMMSMATVGNQILFSRRKTYHEINELSLGNGDGVKDLHSRSRLLLTGSTQVTAFSQIIRSNYNLSMYVSPESFKNARNLGALTNEVDVNTNFFANNVTETSRFDSDKVREIETRLDAEYVPFYFHDLRTNEVLSFYAFLSDLSDGFSANYTSTQGYGRADEVMVYNSTKRSMSLTFFLGATSKEDHNKMYWDINKLVSMVYPQYSRGRVLQTGNLKFVQPFSQLPTASPMIRLRVGDIVKGNYSRFGLARLFGLGQNIEAFNADRVSGDTSTQTQSTSQAPPDRSVGERAATDALDQEKRDGFAVERQVIIKSGKYKFTDTERNQITNRQNTSRPKVASPYNYRQEFVARIVSSRVDPVSSPPAARGQGRQGSQGQGRQRRQGNAAPTEEQTVPSEISRRSYVVRLENPQGPPSRIPDNFKYHVVSHDQIKGFTIRESNNIATRAIVDAQNQRRQTATASGRRPPPDRNPQTLKDFLENNTLIKSFETTLGKGLAGFITDLKFDWNESPWEIAEGSKAPIFMNVSISFSPIHDIPMGLDSDGMMRSVAYNVGNASSVVGSDPYKFTEQGAVSSGGGNSESTSAAQSTSTAPGATGV